jgi:hypothetical protein
MYESVINDNISNGKGVFAAEGEKLRVAGAGPDKVNSSELHGSIVPLKKIVKTTGEGEDKECPYPPKEEPMLFPAAPAKDIGKSLFSEHPIKRSFCQAVTG